MELSPEANGKYQMKTRFAKFQNLPELMNIFKECADIKTAATLNLDRPDFEMHNINVPATKMQSKMIKNLGERAKLIRAGAVDPTEDNMCKLTVDGRKIGLDQRCMNPSLPDDPNSKVNVCINNVFDIWKQTAERKALSSYSATLQHHRLLLMKIHIHCIERTLKANMHLFTVQSSVRKIRLIRFSKSLPAVNHLRISKQEVYLMKIS